MNIELRPDQIETFCAVLSFAIERHEARIGDGSHSRPSDSWDRLALKMNLRRLTDLQETIKQAIEP